jgi:hypothetical protein
VSNYSPRSLFEYGITMATAYTAFPLRLAAIAGAIFSVIGAAVAIVALSTSWGGTGTVTEPFLAGAVAFVAGIQLLCLGVLGEYVGRLYFRAVGRPQYVVAARTDGRDRTTTHLG